VKLLQVLRRTREVIELVAAKACATREQLAHERPVEHLFEGARDGRFDAGDVADLGTEIVEGAECSVVDVGDEGVADPRERLVGVFQLVERDAGSAAEQQRSRATAVARALPTRSQRFGQNFPQRRRGLAGALLGELVAVLGGVGELLQRLFLDAAAEGQLEEALRAIERAALGCDLGCARKGRKVIRGRVSAPNVSLV
jgi:hypothetical protein